MIRFKDLVLEDYFIDEHTAVITDKFGNVVRQGIHNGYYSVCINACEMKVHCIQAHTKWGYKGHKWHVHHKDGNPLNNDIKNLKYITNRKHMSITHKEKVIAENIKEHQSEIMSGENNPMYGKPSANRGKFWWHKIGMKPVLSYDKPGDGWELGRSIL